MRSWPPFPRPMTPWMPLPQMQKQIVLHPSLKVDGAMPSRFRIGCNFGPVVLENRDVFGLPYIRRIT